jgi:ribose transport system permease protein
VLRDQGIAGLPLAVLAGPAIGLALGLFNGLLISQWSLDPLLVTLSSSLAIRGFAYLSTGGMLVSGVPDEMVSFMSGVQLGLPVLFLIAIAIALVSHVVLSKTSFGLTAKGLGSNAQAAEYVGIPVKRFNTALYAISGLLAGAAAIMVVGRAGSTSPGDYVGIELQAIAACVIGGTQFKGGIGSITGTLLGTLFIGVVLNGLVHVGLPSSYLKLSNGALLIFAVIMDSLRRRGAD